MGPRDAGPAVGGYRSYGAALACLSREEGSTERSRRLASWCAPPGTMWSCASGLVPSARMPSALVILLGEIKYDVDVTAQGHITESSSQLSQDARLDAMRRDVTHAMHQWHAHAIATHTARRQTAASK
mmetsp:Transcript_44239/g.109946  ORF Transcript_44239/g.109946 Transcript_44239/m.109946 type:complete len:128 (+) Transcript_44239:580-963(+)